MKTIIITFILIIASLNLSGQDDSQLIKDIHYYADIVANAMDYDHKIRANEQLVKLVDEAIASDVDVDFEAIKWIVEVKPTDGSFSIISWPIQTSLDAHRYEAYVFKGDKVIKLNDLSDDLIDDYDYMIGDKDNWFGQMYYGIHEFDSQDGIKYVLFGYNAFTSHENIKMADIFYFDDNDEPVFGQQLFASDMKDLRGAKNRVMLRYSDDAPINLNYNPGLGMIVYDHLIPRMGQIAGQGIILTGDGSYEGYGLNEGIWIHKEKLFDHIYEDAPIPTPVLNDGRKSKKDLFGKTKSN